MSNSFILSRLWLQMRFGLITGFIEHLQIVITKKYDSRTELHTPKITLTTSHIKTSHFAMSSLVVAWWQTSTVSSASVLTFLRVRDCLITNSLLQQSALKVKAKDTLWLVVYRQSVRLGTKPLETHDQRFFQLNPCGHNPYATHCLMRSWVYFLWICLAFCQVYVSHL
jgi:hypothetical protein